MSDSPAAIAARSMTDEELRKAIQAVKNDLHEARDYDQSEFDVMDYKNWYNELYELEEELANREAQARYTNLPPLTYSLKEVLV